jgi:hypothetical protein
MVQTAIVGRRRMRLGSIMAVSALLGGLALAGCASGATGGAPQDEVSADACSTASPQVDVVINSIGPREDRQHTIAELNHLMVASGDPEIDADDATFGITESIVKGQVVLSGSVLHSDGSACARATKVTGVVDWRIAVHLGAELVPGSCSYLAVQRHESKHVALDLSLQSVLKARLQDALRDATRQPARGADGMEAREKLQQRVNAAFQSVLDAVMQERNEKQRTIDTPAEHQHVLSSCPLDEFRAAARGAVAL